MERIVRELSIHAAIEEMVFYPAIREAAEQQDDVDDMVLESLEEHHVVKWVLSELDGMSRRARALRRQGDGADGERPPPRRGGGERALPQGEQGCSAARPSTTWATPWPDSKKTAPTHPHPRSPDEPPGNLVAGAGAALIDKAVDTGRKMVRQKAPKLSRPKAGSRP